MTVTDPNLRRPHRRHRRPRGRRRVPVGLRPEINQALEFTITVDGVDTAVVAEVAQQIGDNRVRAIA